MKYLKNFESATKLDNLTFIKNCLKLKDEFKFETTDELFNIRRVVSVGRIYKTILFVHYNKDGTQILTSYDENINLIGSYFISDLGYKRLNLVTEMVKNECSSYDFQKEFLENHPDRVEYLEFIGYNKDIEIEYEHLINADKMGLL